MPVGTVSGKAAKPQFWYINTASHFSQLYNNCPHKFIMKGVLPMTWHKQQPEPNLAQHKIQLSHNGSKTVPLLGTKKNMAPLTVPKKHLIKGALICGERRQTKLLIILWMSVLHRSEQGTCTASSNFFRVP